MNTALAPKLHSTDKRMLFVGILLFVLPITLALSVHQIVTQQVLEYRMQQAMDSILSLINLQTQSGKSADSHQFLMQAFDFDCGYKDQTLLSDPHLSPREVRVVQLQLANGERCSNLGTAVDFHLDSVKKVDDTGIYLGTSRSPLLENRALVYILQLGEHRLLAMVNNRIYSDMLNDECQNCFQLVFNYPGLKPILLGPSLLQQQQYRYSQQKYAAAFELRLTLNAGDELYKTVSRQVWLLLLLMALALGFAGNWLASQWRSRRISTAYLIRQGMAQNEFIPFYQPVVDSRSHTLVGQEALIRWRQPNGQLIPPGQFIPYAEQHGLIIPLTETLLDNIIRDLPALQGWVSINLVAEHLEKGLLSPYLQKLQEDISPLCFELTERQPMTNFVAATEEIEALSRLCHGVKLDDFGTGFGGFGYLQKLGIHSIKIDKMFIDTIGTDDLKRGVLDAIIAFGHESGMEMIAEGVETREQVDYLAAKGVYLIQGYYYSPPLPLSELLATYPAFIAPSRQSA
ncbi:EAL domain-containing protein [Shewanella sp. GXUN23E]|uniref:EAL domain-containing protein n=1 Tax=Shewanella sp. GXUN23E TaxID=3422498 RepID=UPI003D7CA62B